MSPPLPPPPPPPPPPRSSSPPSTPAPAKKRLLSELKCKALPPSTPPNYSTSSSTSNRQLPVKKTRDLPNLSDCHGCGLRINHTNPKDRLQVLDSLWRIVLLCKKCLKGVNSGHSCPYCFREISTSESFRCSRCDRRIHKDCVVNFGNTIPWSYYYSELGSERSFTLCLDCWVPKLLRGKVRVYRRKKGDKAVDKLPPNVGDNGFPGHSNRSKCSGDAVKDVRTVLEKKLAVAVEAKEKAVQKAAVAENALQLASSAISLAAQKSKNAAIGRGLISITNHSSSCGGDTNVTEILGDEELALRLHRVMNSSRRISTSLSPISTSSLECPTATDSKLESLEVGKTPNSSRIKELQVYSRRRKSGKKGTSDGGQVDESSSSRSIHWLNTQLITYKRSRRKHRFITYKRTRFKRRTCSETDTSVIAEEPHISHKENKDTEPRQLEICSMDQTLCSNDANPPHSKHCSSGTASEFRSSEVKPDRYLLKYSRKPSQPKLVSNYESSSHNVPLKNQFQFHASTTLADCSTASKASSDATLQSCVVNLQACACIGCRYREKKNFRLAGK